MSCLDMMAQDLRLSHTDTVTAWLNSRKLSPVERRRSEARLRTVIRQQFEELSDADFLAALDMVRPVYLWRKYLRHGNFAGKQLFIEMACADIMERLAYGVKVTS